MLWGIDHHNGLMIRRQLPDVKMTISDCNLSREFADQRRARKLMGSCEARLRPALPPTI
jgi:hypothetical protein